MSSDLSDYPPPPPPSPKGPGHTKRAGCFVMLASPVLAISPILLALVLYPFVGGSNESVGVGALPWLVFFTAPFSAIVFIVGLVLALTGRKRSA